MGRLSICLNIIFFVIASTQAQKDLRGFWVALWHKKSNLLVRCGPSWQSLKQSPGRVHNRESEQSLGRGKTQITRCGMGEGGAGAPMRSGNAPELGPYSFYFISRRGL